MRTTMNIPDDLLKDVMEISGAKNRTEAVKQALSDYARRLRRDKIKKLRGQKLIDDDFDVMHLREVEKEEYEISD